jgi:hypothetical protein
LWIQAARNPQPLEPPGGLDNYPLWLPEEPLPRGVILGSVELVDCVEGADSPWTVPGYRYQWVLSKPMLLVRPVPHVGRLGLSWRRAPQGQIMRARRDRRSYR